MKSHSSTPDDGQCHCGQKSCVYPTCGWRPSATPQPLSKAQQERAIFLLGKYLATVNRRPGDKSHRWDLTKCDEETRKFFAQIGASW